MEYSEKFNLAIEWLFEVEGAFSNHFADRGGPTKYGITLKTLSEFRGAQLGPDEVRSLSVQEAKIIYHVLYWLPMKLEQIENGLLCCTIFDQCVNRGVPTVARQLQKICELAQDGIMGPRTIEKINFMVPKRLAIELIKESQLSYAEIIVRKPDQAVFLLGWLRRTHRLLSLWV